MADTTLGIMDESHPMWDRLQHQLARRRITIEHATAEALMTWTCSEEVSEAREPRHWTIADLDEARQLFRSTGRFPSFHARAGGPIELVHQHPFYGPVFATGELLNALLDDMTSGGWH